MKKYKLFVPGPVNTSDGMDEVGYFRDDDFAKLVLENEKLLLKAVRCKDGRVIPYTCSGTGAMDAIVTNIISDEDKVLVVDGGTFGHRWYDICSYYVKNAILYPVNFGKDIDIDHFEKTVDKLGISLILMQHHETSSGELYDIKKIGEIAKKRGIIFVADCISSFLTDKFEMDSFGADVFLTATQKGLRLDSGTAYVVLNKNAVQHSKKVKKLNYYNNLDKYLDHYNLGRGQSPFTPSVRNVYQMNKKLRKLNVNEEINTMHKIATTFRKDISDLPLTLVAETPSNFLTTLLLNKKYNTADLNDYLKNRNIVICPLTNVENYLAGSSKTLFKVAHIGCGISDHKELVEEFRRYFANE